MIDSHSLGDPSRRLPSEELCRRFADLAPPPRDLGSLRLLVLRGAEQGRREEPESAYLTVQEGLPGDSWARDTDRNPQSQLTAMEIGVAQRPSVA